MREKHASVRELQFKLLEIVDDIDTLCKKNNIQYFMIGGSALGAARHKGFIPWDDDFDIAMTWENYVKFIAACQKDLDIDKYFLQKERSENWPLYFSKVKMNNTLFKEIDTPGGAHPGIFIDVFCLENIADGKIASRWQYFCSKVVTAQTLGERGYSTASYKKKVAIKLTKIFSNGILSNYFIKQVRKYNTRNTKRVGILFGAGRFNTIIFSREFLGLGKYVEFENRLLPVPEKTHEYLTGYFGDYMQLPPESMRVGHLPTEIKL